MNADNTSGGAAKAKISTVEELTEKYKARSTATAAVKQEDAAAVDEFADIQSNPFFKIIFDEANSPTAKKEAVAKALAFTYDKEEAKQALAEFERFKAYLQSARKDMARQIISLTDTETFSELQGVYSQINDALLDFEQTMTPLTDIIDAIYKLRTNDVTLDIYEEIKRDREHEQKLAAERAEQEAKLDALQAEIGTLNRENATLATDKGFFGGIRKRSLKLIAENEVTLAEKKAELDALTADIETTAKTEGPQTAFAQFKEEKARLRELLDISSDQHKERQQQMIEKAIQFVDTTESRVGQVLTHFDGMNEQIDRLADANFQMRSVYAILNDATDEAHKITEDRRSQIKTDLEGKGEIEKLDAEEKLRNLENHVTQLSKTDVDTTRVLAELTQAGSRVQSMKENNDQQVSNTRALHTSGVAGVADQLSTVLQAVSSAALGEASHAAKMSITRMRDNTSEIAAKEAFRTALGVRGTNQELEKALTDLAKFGDVVQATANIRREALGENRALLEKLQRQAEAVQVEIGEANAIAADIVAGKGGLSSAPQETQEQSAKKPDAFKLG